MLVWIGQGEWKEFFNTRFKPTQAAVKARVKLLKPVNAVKAAEHEAVQHFNVRHRIRRTLLQQVRALVVVSQVPWALHRSARALDLEKPESHLVPCRWRCHG